MPNCLAGVELCSPNRHRPALFLHQAEELPADPHKSGRLCAQFRGLIFKLRRVPDSGMSHTPFLVSV